MTKIVTKICEEGTKVGWMSDLAKVTILVIIILEIRRQEQVFKFENKTLQGTGQLTV